MNWGYKILLVYGVFVAGILFMVFRSSNQKMDLVTTDYYAKELKYQEKIDQVNRVNALSEGMRYQIKGNEIAVYFPKDFLGKQISGTATLYCPADEEKDKQQNFSLLDSALMVTAASNVQYELHINWQAGNLTYYCERKIFIQ